MRTQPISSRGRRGLTLIELLVAVVIAMVVVLAVTNLVIVGEAQKRTTAGGNDASQSGSFAAYALDRALRSAGSGFAQSWDQGMFGCKLSVARDIEGSATAILPRPAAFPAPFQAFLSSAPGSLAAAPVLIGPSMSAGGSDVLVVMGGNASAGDVARPIRSLVSGNLRLDNTIGLAHGDLVLITQPGNANCLLQEVNVTDAAAFAAIGNDVLPIGGTYSYASGLDAMANSAAASLLVLGNVNASNVQFQMFGTDANGTLVAYDLLRGGAVAANPDPILPIADNVVEMRALYGIDTSTPRDNIVDSWVSPTDAWAVDQVLSDPTKMRQIVAVRIALVLRSTNYEKEEVTLERPALFSNAGIAAIAAQSFVAGADARHYRLRVIDATVPLRNMLLLPAS
jgi:type IV pilus assembly protein PilW